jgi:hypothetical protein
MLSNLKIEESSFSFLPTMPFNHAQLESNKAIEEKYFNVHLIRIVINQNLEINSCQSRTHWREYKFAFLSLVQLVAAIYKKLFFNFHCSLKKNIESLTKHWRLGFLMIPASIL